jgi:hypothetical protein
MKIAAILLVVFASFSQSVILNCRFVWYDYNLIGYIYSCDSSAELKGNSTMIEEVQGTHQSGKSNADVQLFIERGSILTTFPTNLASTFPNLPFLKLSSSDLKPFPNLLLFISNGGAFTDINGDLFRNTRKLQHISFYVEKLESVGANLVTGLDDLVYLSFESKGCIQTFRANTPKLIQELTQKLLLQCPPRECPLVRCSLDSEVDELNLEVREQLKQIGRLEGTIREMS